MQWEMKFFSFLFFLYKVKKTSQPPKDFTANFIKQVKHWSRCLDGKFDFRDHLQSMFEMPNKTINMLINYRKHCLELH